MKEFKDRLKIALDGKSIGKFASSSGVTETSIRKYLAGTLPSIKVASELAAALNVNLEWLATGRGASGLEFDNETSTFADVGKLSQIPPSKFIGIPLLDVTASAGHGSVVLDDKRTGFVHFEESWLRSTYHLNPNELFSLQAVGESMEPTIKPGEFLLVSTAEQHVKPGDGIFVIRIDGNILVKRLQVMPGKIKVSSDNATMYQSYEIELLKIGDFAVLGKVLLVHGLRRI